MTKNDSQSEQKTLRGFIIESTDGEITHILATIDTGGWLLGPNGEDLQLKIGKNTDGALVAPITDSM